MPEQVAEGIVLAAALWLGCGLVFALAFAWRGAERLDSAAKASSLGFRLLLVPAAAALWPWLLRRWALAGNRGGGGR